MRWPTGGKRPPQPRLEGAPIVWERSAPPVDRDRTSAWIFVGLLLLALGAWLPWRFVVVQPGKALAASEIVGVEGGQPVGGQWLILTVRADRAWPWNALLAAVRPDWAVRDRSQLIPSGLSDREFEQRAEREMRTSQGLAAVAAMRLLGLKADARPTKDGYEFQLPRTVQFEASDVGGPSAGLALALEIFDQLSPEDLAGGRVIAVTGTIDAAGNVGRVSGLRQKLRLAETAGAALLIVPEANLAEVREIGVRIPVVGVTTLGRAVEAARSSR